MGKFDIYDYVHNNRFKITTKSKSADNVSKAYNDIRKTNINEVKVVNGKFSLKESLDANKSLATDVKKHFLEIISTYNGFEDRMKRPSDIASIAETLGGIVEAASTLTLSEDGDWFDKVTVKRNMRELEKLDKDFGKVASEARSLDNRLQALYEDMGNILSRYYTISDIDPQVMKQRLGEKSKIEQSQISESFSSREQKMIKKVVEKCFNERGNKGVRDYDTLNKYLGKLPFEVDAADIEIGGWESQSFNRQIKNAPIKASGKEIGYLQN